MPIFHRGKNIPFNSRRNERSRGAKVKEAISILAEGRGGLYWGGCEFPRISWRWLDATLREIGRRERRGARGCLCKQTRQGVGSPCYWVIDTLAKWSLRPASFLKRGQVRAQPMPRRKRPPAGTSKRGRATPRQRAVRNTIIRWPRDSLLGILDRPANRGYSNGGIASLLLYGCA